MSPGFFRNPIVLHICAGQEGFCSLWKDSFQNFPGLLDPDLIAIMQDIPNRLFDIVKPEWSTYILFRDDSGFIASFGEIPDMNSWPVRKG